MAGQKTISSQVTICQNQFQPLLDSGVLEQFESSITLPKWKDELGRFRVWIFTGAHRTRQSSLDYRLRDASHIRIQVTRQLHRLHRLLMDLHDITEEAPDAGLSESDEEFEVDLGNEVQLIYSDLLHTITRLYEMSIIIRKPSAHDRLQSIQRSDYSHFELNDRQHVYAKYPDADKWILDRLGLAISKRRALLRYRERHQQTLEYEQDDEGISRNLAKAMTTELGDPAMYPKSDQSESDRSMASYENVTTHSVQEISHSTPPENEIGGKLFLCELCRHIIEIRDQRHWVSQVFRNLLPYVCIYPDCTSPDRLYERRHQWSEHLDLHHPISLGHTSNSESDAECILCQKTVTEGPDDRRHLASHLEDLSLFALPPSFVEKLNHSELVNEGEQTSTARSLDDNSLEAEMVGALSFRQIQAGILTYCFEERNRPSDQ
ncbi:hypothetical protein N7488_008410 [Penicillium malachiteum]|nr:hypothetical protein N7488_008410 [Penicillium malachiteum]